jgi:hypothetical protein
MYRGRMQRSAPIRRRTLLAKQGKSEVALIKKEIQALLRELVMRRDKGCILRDVRCSHEIGDAGIVFQAEHLIERSNSATYADPRLIVCVCKNCHGWKHFKKSNHDEYDRLVKERIEPERVALWEACEKNLHAHRPHRMTLWDWKKEAAYLRTKIKVL